MTVGVLALGAVAGTGLAAQADGTDPADQAAPPAKASQPTSQYVKHPNTQAAVDGYQIVKLPNANVSAFTRRYVYCPAGKRVIGGGGEAQGNGAILVGSFPTDDGRGWIALGRQDGYSTVGISVYAICANAT